MHKLLILLLLSTPFFVNDAVADTHDMNAASEVRDLADELWEFMLENSTYLRLQEGLPIEKFEDLTLERYNINQAIGENFRARLQSIDPSSLNGDDLITYEILQFELRDSGTNEDDYWLTFDITSYQGAYLFRFAQQALLTFPINDKTSADHYLILAEEYADIIDQNIAKVEGQMQRGLYLPKPALPATRLTWQGIKEASRPSLQVNDDRLSALPVNDREIFMESLSELQDRVEAGFDRLVSLIGDEYEAAAPEEVGLRQYPNGEAVYQRFIKNYTSLDLTPQEIHERGIKAVNEIESRMTNIRRQLGFEGTAREFIDQIMVDERFIARSSEEIETIFNLYIDRIEPLLDDYFKNTPKAAYGVRRLPLAAEAGMTYGYYNLPTASDPVGYYNYNGSNPEKRSLIWAGSLIYHELLPGHHFHLATQNENKILQDYRRKYTSGAFTEGYAEYAASLGIEMGMYEDPYELYGRYLAEIFLASRLAVDTGLNALGWSLQEARDYMAKYVVQSKEEIASETLRYSTSIPAQALNYRLGYEKHWELRRRAEAALGEQFDIREYHDIVLSDGSKPLVVLELKVDRWIASKSQF
jgi:uncharacterized protein (DUF885 family)|tara:strand:- start:199 stop:1956 length:1758 start_codon:yes stop_codon:yes gene_type:complete